MTKLQRIKQQWIRDISTKMPHSSQAIKDIQYLIETVDEQREMMEGMLKVQKLVRAELHSTKEDLRVAEEREEELIDELAELNMRHYDH